jgi:HAD superfamily hydrolase (TIGR01509 family)
MIRHLVYDLDGTLIDSALDFDQMRLEMGLPHGAPILETLAHMPAEEAQRCWSIVERHELEGAERASPYPGVIEFITSLAEHGVRQAVLTRNSRAVAEAMLRHIPFTFDVLVTRDEGPIKPDPRSIWRICAHWGVAAQHSAMIGDSHFDMETGRRAGARNVLIVHRREKLRPELALMADLVLHAFDQHESFLAWLNQSV